MMDDDDDEERGFFRRHRVLLILGSIGLIGVGTLMKLHKPSSAPAAPERIVMLTMPPPPPKPIPTPPPVQQPPPEQKLTEQKQVLEPEAKSEAPKPEPPKPDEPPPSMGSNIKGAGDSFGLSGSGNGGVVGIGGNGNGSGSPYARYAAQIKNRIADALKNNKRTRAASYRAKLKLWLGADGKITRAVPLEGNDGGAAAALVGVKMLDQMPPNLPMPVTTEINSVRP